jgi:hypothetical protein
MSAHLSTVAESETPSIEEEFNHLLEQAKTKARGVCEASAQRVRQSPGKAVMIAAGVGYFLHRLPVGALLVSQVRLIAALAPPVLLAAGAAKLCGFVQKQAHR